MNSLVKIKSRWKLLDEFIDLTASSGRAGVLVVGGGKRDAIITIGTVEMLYSGIVLLYFWVGLFD